MHTFAEKPKATHGPASNPPTSAGQVRLESTAEVKPILEEQRGFAEPAAQGSPGARTSHVKGTATTGTARFGHDLSRTPVHNPGAGVIQAKLAVNRPGDEYEQEADRVADQVMRMAGPAAVSAAPAASILRQAVAGRADEDDPFSQTMILRKAQFTAPHTAATPSPAIADRLAARRAGGEPLSAATRRGMEQAFGHDFSRVRIHRDAEASAISQTLSALAFTQGSHIYFAGGRYDPHGSAGRRLLAHELTHVVQQGQAAPQPDNTTATPAIAVQSSAPAVQRFALWRPGVVHEAINLAEAVMTGGPAGITPPTLNGATILSEAEARAAIIRPVIAFSPAPAGGFNAKVDNTPINTGSFDETVLAPGPWTTVSPKAAVGATFPTLAACAGAGDSTFQAFGDPSDQAMFDANRRHEDHHAADHETAFNGSLVPWDSNLIVAEVLDEEFHGATEADAEAALWARMGGTPDDVADEYINEALRMGNAFHLTPKGGPVGAPTDIQSNADCSTSSAKFTNPS